jgi:hypothetical protein
MPTSRHQEGAAGQAIVIMVFAMFAVIAAVALIIDGGNAMAHQRMSQNAADAAAEAGAVIMAEEFAGASTPAQGWDVTVAAAINSAGTANGVTITGAYYTDICGIPLQADGTKALNADNTYNFALAMPVGNAGNAQPAVTSSTPDCPNTSPGPVAGVLVQVHQSVRTYLAGVIGLDSIGVSTQATAAAGYLQETCAASQGAACGMVPIAIPIDVITCSKSNGTVDSGTKWSADGHTVYVIPLCTNGDGNVGWIDWTGGGGGTNDLLNSINSPNNPAVPLPSWQWVSQTGNTNSSALQTALRRYNGQIVLVPQFDLTCFTTPDESQVSNPTTNYGCSNVGGHGSNNWYRMPSFAHLQLCGPSDPDCVAAGYTDGAYISANNNPTCGGNGATSCVVGKFESIVSTGTIGAGIGGGQGNSKAVGVQLIK